MNSAWTFKHIYMYLRGVEMSLRKSAESLLAQNPVLAYAQVLAALELVNGIMKEIVPDDCVCENGGRDTRCAQHGVNRKSA